MKYFFHARLNHEAGTRQWIDDCPCPDFLLTIGGMLATGWAVYNKELVQHHATPLTLFSYARSGHFLSALFENWESEFLQMSAYVMLTAFLFQRGSSESKTPTSHLHRMKTLRKSR